MGLQQQGRSSRNLIGPADFPPPVVEVWFLPCNASAERGDATVSRLSVCPSVRP